MYTTEYLRVGRIVGTHGIRGEARVLSNTDFPELRFAPGTTLYLQHPNQSETFSVQVESSRPHKNVYLVKFRGWDRLEDAQQWKDAKLLVPMSEATRTELDPDEFYYHQIIGCQVQTTEGKTIGIVQEIWPMPANDVWLVESNEDQKEILLPFVKEIVKTVDVEAKKITIVWMEGLDSS